jgi:diadenosine tetraphosphate (Ap4A) HIT family hydrolase
MTRPTIDKLPKPKKRYNVAKLDPKFETRASAFAEDKLRRQLLRRTANKASSTKLAKRLRKLAKKLDSIDGRTDQVTLASSQTMRSFRIRFIAAVLQLIDVSKVDDLTRFDLLKPSWIMTFRQLRRQNAKQLMEQFRADLLRAARQLDRPKTRDNSGFVIACLHGEHLAQEDGTEHFHPHIHLIASGDWIEVVDALRQQRGYASGEQVSAPLLAHRNVSNLPHALTYLCKAYWPAHWEGTLLESDKASRSRGHRRVPEPLHSKLLLWLDRQPINDCILRIGLTQNRFGLQTKIHLK